MFTDIIYNPNSCGQHVLTNEFTHVTSWRQKLLPFQKACFGTWRVPLVCARCSFPERTKLFWIRGLDISRKLLRIVLGKKRFHLNIPIYLHVLTKNATSELPSLLFFASQLFNLVDWRYRFCIVPTFCFHNVSPWILNGNPTHPVDMWLVFLHWLSFRWPSKNGMAAMTIGQLTFHDMDMDATR